VLILLPPSEGKDAPDAGPKLALTALSWPGLKAVRSTILRAVVDLCTSSPTRAMTALGLTASQKPLIAQNARLRSAPTAPAIDVYAGVLYDALDFSSLPAAARARADSRIAIASALWGLVRPHDHIPAYRFSADSRVPGLPSLAQLWSAPMGSVITQEKGVIVDLRSGAYVTMAPIPEACADRAVTLRVLQEKGGKLSVVSHHNKATKGRITAALLTETREPRSVDHLPEVLRSHGYRVEDGRPSRTGVRSLDVIVHDL